MALTWDLCVHLASIVVARATCQGMEFSVPQTRKGIGPRTHKKAFHAWVRIVLVKRRDFTVTPAPKIEMVMCDAQFKQKDDLPIVRARIIYDVLLLWTSASLRISLAETAGLNRVG